MHRNLSKVGLTVLLVAGVLVWAVPVDATAAEKRGEKTKSTPERLIIAKNKNTAHPKDRVDAIRDLGNLNDVGEVRDQRVVDALCEIVKDTDDDLFVRMEGINSLGNLQFNLFQTDGLARNKFTIPLISVMKDDREEELLQTKVAQVFGRTLPADDLQAKQAITAMLDIAKNKNQPMMLRVACVDAVSEIGSADGFETFGVILGQSELDSLVQERVLRGMSVLLGKLGSADTVRQPSLPTINRIIDLVFSNATPVEIRAVGFVALARMKKSGIIKTLDIQPRLVKIMKESDSAELVIAAVEAIGILDEAGATNALVAVYADFFDTNNPTRDADVKIRLAVVKTLGDLVNSQTTAKDTNAVAVKQIAELYLKIIALGEENQEVASTKDNVIFGLRYFYPKKKEFKLYHQPIVEALILLLRKDRAAKTLPVAIVDTLTTISRYPGGDDLNRWEKWYDKAYPNKKLPKEEPDNN
jgi:hypothetical protein